MPAAGANLRWRNVLKILVSVAAALAVLLHHSPVGGSPGIGTTWERRHDHASKWDNGLAVCLDSAGNSYVAAIVGSVVGFFDLKLLKYDPAGNLLWTHIYATGEYEAPSMVAIDPAGNVWVTGTEGPGDKHLLLKLNGAGIRMFAKAYSFQGRGNGGMHIAFDSSGYPYASSGNAVFKFDPNGNVLWFDSTFGGGGNGIVVDPTGNSYVCADRGVRAYTPSGAVRWTQDYVHWGAKIVMAPDRQSVCVTGWNSLPGTIDYVTTKYDTASAMMWQRNYGGPGADEAEDIGSDAVGNIYVTGTAGTIKYDPEGALLWSVGPAYSYAENKRLAVDSSGRVYVSTIDGGMFTRCISPDGVLLWGRSFQNGADGRPQDMARTNDGTVVVTGEGLGSGYDVITVRYDLTDCVDTDGDMACDSDDICPDTPDPLQRDLDHDGIGNDCDTCPTDPLNDSDADGICHSVDNCPTLFNPDQTDADGDSIGDACDPCVCLCYGDPDCDGVLNDVLDVVGTVNVAFRNGEGITDPNPTCPREATDVDCSGGTDVIDVVKVVNVAFRNANVATEYCDPCQ